jgi:hypothetical protein
VSVCVNSPHCVFVRSSTTSNSSGTCTKLLVYMHAFRFNCNSLPLSPACPCSSCRPLPILLPAPKRKCAKKSGGMKFYRRSQRFVALTRRYHHRPSNQRLSCHYNILIRRYLKSLENAKSSMLQQSVVHWLLGRAVCSWALLKYF